MSTKTKTYKMKKILLIIAFLFWQSACFSQINDTVPTWTESEKAIYSKLIGLAEYVQGKENSQILKPILFEKYIKFDYILKDTSLIRIESRLQTFDTLFYYFRKPIDSLGIESLDAKPIRFFKDHTIYEPFDEDKAMRTISGKKMFTNDSSVFVYFRKDDPENPLGALWFDPETYKLISWIMINQGGYKYFLTFSML